MVYLKAMSVHILLSICLGGLCRYAPDLKHLPDDTHTFQIPDIVIPNGDERLKDLKITVLRGTAKHFPSEENKLSRFYGYETVYEATQHQVNGAKP